MTMGWRTPLGRGFVLASLLACLFGPVLLTTTAAASPDNQRLFSVEVNPDSTSTIELTLEANTANLLAWNCTACSVSTDDAKLQTSSSVGQTMVIITNQTTTIALEVTGQNAETVDMMLLEHLNDGHPTTRPAPGEDDTVTSIQPCMLEAGCTSVTLERSTANVALNAEAAFLIHGLFESDKAEYLTFNVSEGETMEWQWLATSDEVQVELYHQTGTDERLLPGKFVTPTAFNTLNQATRSMWWTVPEDGRVVAKVSSPMTDTVWAAYAMTHQPIGQTSLIGEDLQQGINLLGYGQREVLFQWNDTEALRLQAVHANVSVTIDQLMDGQWVDGQPQTITPDESFAVYPYPNTSVGRLILETASVMALEVQSDSFTDANGLEAPSYRPASLETNNGSWPILNLTSVSQGEFTLAVHDTVDTYRLVVDGWEDSIHFVQFTISGDLENLEVQLWDIDQNSGEVLATDITEQVGGELKIGLQVGRGTHYFQLRFQNASAETPHLWGVDVAPRTYTIQGAYSLVDEGEEPWFPPDEDAVFWGGVARWFLGALFLIPVFYLAYTMQTQRRFAEELATAKQRLAWYTARLDSGETDNKTARSDLAKVLQVVAQLDWQEGLDAWGEQRTEHRTEDVALAVWQTDPRLAKSDGAWPLVVGVHVLQGEWELVALRFDAPEGQAFSVVEVEPRFLRQGEEVFLDEMQSGHKAYLLVELDGPANQVDVELNGRMNGQPVAARIPETVSRIRD